MIFASIVFLRICNFRFDPFSVFEKTRSSYEVRPLGLGGVPNEPGAEIGAGPDQYTACKVLNSHPDMLANLQNLYVQALLAKYQIIQVCIACQVVDMDDNALLAR